MALVVVFFVVILTIGYFSVPLSSKSIIPHSNQIERIYFTYPDEGKTNYYLIEFNVKNSNLKRLTSIFDSVSYTRSIGSKNIRNDGKTLIMYVIYRDRNGELLNYDLDINEKGYVVSDKKKFKMADEDKEVFKQLSKFVLDEGIKTIGTIPHSQAGKRHE